MSLRTTNIPSLQRDQASLDSFRREYELGVRAQAERCEAAALTTEAAALTRLAQFVARFLVPSYYRCMLSSIQYEIRLF